MVRETIELLDKFSKIDKGAVLDIVCCSWDGSAIRDLVELYLR